MDFWGNFPNSSILGFTGWKSGFAKSEILGFYGCVARAVLVDVAVVDGGPAVTHSKAVIRTIPAVPSLSRP